MTRKPNGYMDAHIAEAALVGISRKTFYRRLEIGWSLEEAKTRPLNLNPRKGDCPFLRAAKRRGIDGNTFRNRVRRGWSKAKAAVTPKQQQFREWNYQ